jgi:hypothetical protein
MNPDATPAETLARLEALIGSTVSFLGMTCRISDLVVSPALLVLKPLAQTAEIQTDSYGQPWRRGQKVIEIPVFGEDGRTPSTDLMDLSLPDPPC